MSLELASEIMANLRPWVRFAKIQETPKLFGTWTDFDHELTFIRDGVAEIIVDGQRFELGPGDCILMAPFVTHFKRSVGTNPLVQYILHFDMVANPYRYGLWPIGVGQGARWESAPKDEVPWPGAFVLQGAKTEVKREIDRILTRIIEEYQSDKPIKELQMRALVTEVLVLLVRASVRYETSRSGRSWSLVSMAADLMNQLYEKNSLSNEVIAQKLDISPHYLGDIFVKHMGVTMRDYLLSVRLTRSRALLENGDSVSNIALSTGFGGIHAFSRAFKRELGISPSQYASLHKTEV